MSVVGGNSQNNCSSWEKLINSMYVGFGLQAGAILCMIVHKVGVRTISSLGKGAIVAGVGVAAVAGSVVGIKYVHKKTNGKCEIL